MGRTSQDVIVRFIGDTGNLGKGMDGLKGRFVGVASSLDGIAKAGAAIGAISFFKSAINESREAERVGRKTEAVLRSTGQVAGVTAQHISGLAGRLSEVAAVDDEVIQQGGNVLLTFTKVRNEAGKTNDVFDRATKVSLDMAAALDQTGDSGASMQENVIRIGKALNDPVKGMTALTKVGVAFTEQQKEQVKALVENGDQLGAQKIILDELETEFGGMAAASADGWGKAKVALGNFAEEVGARVMPAVEGISNWAISTGIPALGDVADTVGNVVEPAFGAVVDAGRGVLGFWQDLPEPVQMASVAMGAWALVGGRVTSALSTASGPLKTFTGDVRTAMGAFDVNALQGSMMVMQERIPIVGQMGAAFRTAKGDTEGFGSTLKGVAAGGFAGLKGAATGVMSLLGGPWGLALGAGVALLTIFTAKSAAAEKRQNEFAEAGRNVAKAIAEQNGVLNLSTRQAASKESEDKGLLKLAQEMGIALPRVTDAVEGQKGAYSGLKTEIDKIVEARQADLDKLEASRGISRERMDAAQAEVDKAKELRDGLATVTSNRDGETAAAQRQAQATATVGSAASGIVPASQMLQEMIEAQGGTFDEAAGFANNLANAILNLQNVQASQMDSLEGYEASYDLFTAAIAEHGRTLDINTVAGRANRDALQDVANKSLELMAADIAAGVPADQALARHRARTEQLKQEAIAAFGANSDAVALINTYGKVPKDVETTIKLNRAEEVGNKLKELSAGQYLLAAGKPLTQQNVKAVVQEQKYAFAAGGQARGPGGPRGDKIHAMLSDGEFVHQAAAVDYYGVGTMSAINRRQIPRDALRGYAGGGLVWPFTVDVGNTKIPDPPSVGVGGTNVAAMQAWARAQIGKRYLWGAVGPGNYDCSGLVGNLWAMANGKPLYRRYFTTASMGVGKNGMKPGKGAVTVYLGPGHTAANVGGLHVEAYGGNGVPLAVGRVGTPLSYYNTIMHLAKGGVAQLKNNQMLRAESWRDTGWPEPTKYDSGGLIPPGLSTVYNGTGRPEAVFTEDQLAQLGGVHIHLHNKGVIGSRHEMEDWLAKTFSKLKSQGRLPRGVG